MISNSNDQYAGQVQKPTPRDKLMQRLRKSPVTLILIAVTTVVYLIQIMVSFITGISWMEVLFAKVNSGLLQGQVWRLITPVLLHGSMLHILLNMYALLIIGSSLERVYGQERFLGLYIIAGVWGNMLSYLLTPAVSLGASTAIFGLIVAQVVLIFRNRNFYGRAAQPLLINLAVVIMLNLMLGFAPGIDQWGHIGGMLGGVIYAWLCGPVFSAGDSLFGFTLSEEQKISYRLVFFSELALAILVVIIAILM